MPYNRSEQGGLTSPDMLTCSVDTVLLGTTGRRALRNSIRVRRHDSGQVAAHILGRDAVTVVEAQAIDGGLEV